MAPARKGALLLAAVLFSVAARPASAADPSRDYRAGLRALRDGRLEEAAEALRRAIQADRQEGIHKLRLTGINFEDYFPHLYLGLALEGLGRRAEAIAELEESERQAAVYERSELRGKLQGALDRLRSAQAAARPQPTAPPPLPAPTSVPPPLPTAVVRPTSPPVVLPTPRPAAPTPAQVLAKATAAPRPTAPRVALSATPPPEPGRNDAATLRKGLDLYFGGRYDEAIAELRPLARSRPAAELLLAYSLASKAVLADPRDDGLIREARGHYRDGLARGGRPLDAALVPPKILKLLD